MSNDLVRDLEELFGPMEVIQMDVGDHVLCDLCNKDYTNSDISGGFLLSSNAVCPDCSEKTMVDIKKYNEEKHIKGTCPSNMSFANWIRSIR